MNNLYFTPLSLSQLLKEKGVKQESMFYWNKGIAPATLRLSNPGVIGYQRISSIETSDHRVDYSAFTLSELPDVFRQVFKERSYEDTLNGDWDYFCSEYFREPIAAWSWLEKTIKSLS